MQTYPCTGRRMTTLNSYSFKTRDFFQKFLKGEKSSRHLRGLSDEGNWKCKYAKVEMQLHLENSGKCTNSHTGGKSLTQI